MAVVLLGLGWSLPVGAHAQEASPLDPFDRLVGGAWHLDGSYQVFEWGVDRKIVRASSYGIIEGDTVLVAEGSWFWHPGRDRVEGTLAASDMAVWFFDYETRFEENTFIHDLTSYGQMGGDYEEHWELTDADHYEWTLFQKTEEGLQRVFGGTFERVAWPAG